MDNEFRKLFDTMRNIDESSDAQNVEWNHDLDGEDENDERCWRCNGPADEGRCMDDCTHEEELDEARGSRVATNRIIEMMDEQLLDPQQVAEAALSWMSEQDAYELAVRYEWFGYDDDEDEYEESSSGAIATTGVRG